MPLRSRHSSGGLEAQSSARYTTKFVPAHRESYPLVHRGVRREHRELDCTVGRSNSRGEMPFLCLTSEPILSVSPRRSVEQRNKQPSSLYDEGLSYSSENERGWFGYALPRVHEEPAISSWSRSRSADATTMIHRRFVSDHSDVEFNWAYLQEQIMPFIGGVVR